MSVCLYLSVCLSVEMDGKTVSKQNYHIQYIYEFSSISL